MVHRRAEVQSTSLETPVVFEVLYLGAGHQTVGMQTRGSKTYLSTILTGVQVYDTMSYHFLQGFARREGLRWKRGHGAGYRNASA